MPVATRVIQNPMTLYRARVAEMGARCGNPEIDAWRRANEPNIRRGLDRLAIAEEHGIGSYFGFLWLKRYNTTEAQLDQMLELGLLEAGREPEAEAWVREHASLSDFGLASARVVTTAGVNFLVDAFQGTVEPEVMRYHGIGTDNTAENVSDTALGAELTTVYATDNTRATGTLTEGASANIFRTVGTNSVDGSATITEHGIFSQAANSGGTLLDRSVFSGVALSSGNSLQTTYELTLAAGS